MGGDSPLQQYEKIKASGGLNPVQQTEYDALLKSAGGSSGGANTASYDQLLKSLPKAADYANQINTGINNDFQTYLDAINKAPKAADTYQANLEAAGIPNLQKTASSLQGQVYSLEDALRAVEGNVAGTTQNSLVTQAQRAGMIEARQKPLQENLGTISTALGRITDAINQGKSDALTLTGLSQQDSKMVLDAYSKKLDIAMTQGAQSLQAFISDTNNVLNTTLAKIHRGEQVSDQEAQNAFELLKLNKTAELELENAKATADLGGDNSKRYITLGDGTQLYDTQTNQIIASNAKDYKAGGGTGSTGGSIGSGGSGRVGDL